MKATPRSYLLAFIQAVLFLCAAPAIALAVMALITGCSPRAFDSVNKQAPDPPYMGQRHSGLDRVEYLRVEGPLGK